VTGAVCGVGVADVGVPEPALADGVYCGKNVRFRDEAGNGK
jgi:hypothetical protein